eukprot:CAMPEP_0197617748 /NCGR_PEP_ID=MMETSP1326-20131121/61189_1 /TAXON_ID=1155430 /ORGANISM="Genus nov. species nov., Strain RCC2288" /LENGTH=932 /DNA_ID=CAMNT_0043186643 /DNA_START=68 /DNA_END=2866 /DNA_ORIENTATION=-
MRPCPTGMYQPPSVKLAERHAQTSNPQHVLVNPLRVAPSDLNEYGIGIVLYFTFLRLLVLAFAALSLLAFPSLVANLAGDTLGQSEDPMALAMDSASLGNYGRLYSWTRGGAASNATLDAMSGAPPAPPPVTIPGSATDASANSTNFTGMVTLPWEHGPALRIELLGTKHNKDELSVALSYVDLLLLAVFAVFALGLGPFQSRLAAAVDKNLTTIEDYSVLVSGIPNDTLDPQELWKFIGKRVGTVVDVQIAHNDSELLGLAFERGRIAEQMERTVARWKKAMGDPKTRVETVKALEAEAKQSKKSLRAVNAAIRQLQNLRGTGSQSVCAYVTFQDEEHFLKCFKLYRPGLVQWLLRKQELRFRGTHRLTVTQAPPPTDIQWENLEYTWLQRTFRSFSVNLLAVGILAAAFASIAAVKAMKEGTVVEIDVAPCRAMCSYTVSPKLTLHNETLRGTYAECFKREAYLKAPPAPPAPSPPPVSFGRHRRRDLLQTAGTAQSPAPPPPLPPPSPPPYFNASSVTCGPYDAFCFSCYCLELITASAILKESEYCSVYVTGYSMQLIAGATAQGIIVVMNTFLNWVILKLVRFERHHSASSEQRSVMLKLFVSQFFNTAVNLVVISASFPWLKRQLKGSTAEGLLFEGDKEDLSPKWYQEVGYALVLSMLVNPMAQRAQTFVRSMKFKWQRTAARTAAVTQRQLNEAYEGEEFVLSVRYGEILNIIFVTMTFSAGIPLLVPLAAFSFWQHYLVDRYDFLRVAKLPPRYSTALADGAAEVMAYASIGHLLFFIWANSFHRMDPDPFVYGLLGSYIERGCEIWGKNAPAPLDTLFGAVPDTADVARRVLQRNTAWGTLTLAVVIAVLLLRTTATQIRMVLALALPSIFLPQREAEGNPSFDVAVQGRQLAGPTTYCVKEMPDYVMAYQKVAWEQDDGTL